MKKEHLVLSTLILGYVIVILCTLNHPFFWDGLYNARCATYFFNEGYNGFILPNDFDAGHPPFFAAYLTLGWDAFGRTLLTSHLLYAPIVLSIGLTGFLLFKKTLPKELLPVACLGLFIEPTILTQATVIHQDLLMASLYLLSSYFIVSNKKSYLLLPLLLLPMLSLRGAVMVAALGLTDLLLTDDKRSVFSFKNLTPYIISLIGFISWGTYHYHETGWAYFTQSPGYSDSRGFNSLLGMGKNTAVIVRNLVDCGRILLMISTFVLIVLKRSNLKPYKKELILFLIPTLLLSFSFIPFKNPIGHRYFLISYILIIPLFIKLVKDVRFKTFILAGTYLSYVIGQFIVYPSNFSQGWDSNLSHTSYFDIRSEVDLYINSKGIPANEIGTNFPLKYAQDVRRLEGTSDYHSDINLDTSNYLLLSNICNDIKLYPSEILDRDFQLLFERKERGVFILLYKRK